MLHIICCLQIVFEKECTDMFNQLTEKDIQKMEEEIEYINVVVSKEKHEAVKEAKAQGDLSENFEY